MILIVKKICWLFLGLSMMSLTACVTIDEADYDKPLGSEIIPSVNKGLLVASITRQISDLSQHGAIAFFFVRDKKTGVEFEMSSKSMVSTQQKKPTHSIRAYKSATEPLNAEASISLASEITNTKDQAGRVLAFELEPGMYEISKWKVVTSGGIDFAHFDSEHRPPIAFEVKSGEVSYLCNCHIDVDMGENIFGLAVEDGAEAAIYDKMQRDMQYVDEKYPNLRELKVNNIAANLRVIEHPLAP